MSATNGGSFLRAIGAVLVAITAVFLTAPDAQAATALASAGGPSAVSDPTSPSRATQRRLAMHRRVFVVGDSLTVGAGPQIRKALRGRVAGVEVNAAIGRFTSTGLRILSSRRAARAAVWVVALGTNDAPSAPAMRAAVQRVMRMAGKKRKVVWVNVVRPGGYGRVNRELSIQDRRHTNLSVLDWARVVAHHRSYLASDRVHLTSTGYRVRGSMIARAARAMAGTP